MKKNIKKKIKDRISSRIRKYLMNRKITTYQILDDIFPQERRIRSLIGGLETSLGTTLWEPLAKELALSNGFEILNEKEFPAPSDSKYPNEILNIMAKWEQKRKSEGANISLDGYIKDLKSICKSKDFSEIKRGKLTKGIGVDIYLKKDGREYAFDIKTVQINAGGGLHYSKTLMWWYAARIMYNHDVDLKAALVFPFNPYKKKTWWEANGSRAYPLLKGVDGLVQDDFWDFISGEKNTFHQIQMLFKELGEENFGQQFQDIFRPS